jgi:hypothetical protein
MTEPILDLLSSARFVPSQKGTNLLQDANNYTYRIHNKCEKKKIADYRCTRRMSAKCPAVATLDLEMNMIVKILHEHVHTSNILRETARKEEKKMIETAANVGRVSVEILSKLKTNLERSANPGEASSIRKSRILAKAISREKRKIMGHSATILKSAEEIKENLPDKFLITSTGGIFKRFCDFVDDQKKLMMIFMSDHGGWVLGRSLDIFADGTFDTSPDPFTQIYFVMGKMGPEKRAIPCVYALLPDKETNTYNKMWTIIYSLVKFEDGLPQRIMTDFEKGVMNTLSSVFPLAEVCKMFTLMSVFYLLIFKVSFIFTC